MASIATLEEACSELESGDVLKVGLPVEQCCPSAIRARRGISAGGNVSGGESAASHPNRT